MTFARHNGVTPFVTDVLKFRDAVRTGDQRRLIAEQRAADSVLCPGFRAYRLQL
jgi:hypothetical protein